MRKRFEVDSRPLLGRDASRLSYRLGIGISNI